MKGTRKKMTHIRNVLTAIEERGYVVNFIAWTGDNITAVISHPLMAGNPAFLENAYEEAVKKNNQEE